MILLEHRLDGFNGFSLKKSVPHLSYPFNPRSLLWNTDWTDSTDSH